MSSERCGDRWGLAVCDLKKGHDGCHSGPIGQYESYISWANPSERPDYKQGRAEALAEVCPERDAWAKRARDAEAELARLKPVEARLRDALRDIVQGDGAARAREALQECLEPAECGGRCALPPKHDGEHECPAGEDCEA